MTFTNRREFYDFVDYVHGFYGDDIDDAIYPIEGCTRRVCWNTCRDYVVATAGTDAWGYGDSVDRERVRDMIFAKGYKEKTA
tara:strand:+ start:2410 stop:2655 length:246 start_codon:yes stop_codon:yes gene_type:complete